MQLQQGYEIDIDIYTVRDRDLLMKESSEQKKS